MNFLINVELVRGKPKHTLQWFDRGERHRLYFDTQAEAEAAKKAEIKKLGHLNRWWAGLSSQVQIDLAAVCQEIQTAGHTLRGVWDGFRQGTSAAAVQSIALRDACYGCIAAKKVANCDAGYLTELERAFRKFYTGRETLPLTQITSAVCQDYLAAIPNTESRKTVRARLSALFSWAVRQKHLPENPLDALESIRTRRTGAPEVLNPDQAAIVLETARRCSPAFLRYTVLAMMAGIRPEETDKIDWPMVRGEWEAISLPADLVKKNTPPRLVPIPEAARAWLALAGRGGSCMLSRSQRRRYLRRCREELGWAKWPKDVLRHTAASYKLAVCQDLGLVSRELGNSVAVLTRHYINPRTKEEAAAFWALRPASNGSPKPPENGAQVESQEPAAQVESGNGAAANVAPQSALANAKQGA